MFSSHVGKSRTTQVLVMWLQIAVVLFVSLPCGGEECTWGIYGRNCDRACPTNCDLVRNTNLTHCQQDTGTCSEGCVRGYHGDQCNISCSRGCLNETCNQGNGYCTLGCKETYIGDFCNETSVVTTHTTSSPTQASPQETATNVVIIVPVVAVPLCLVILAVVIYVVLKRRRRIKANIESRFQEKIPLMDKNWTDAAIPLMDKNRTDAANPLDQKINNTRTVFVETESFKKVRGMLETFHHVTISGAPGAGKTSMALMLGDQYRKQGYEVVLVEDLDKVQLSDWQGKDVCLIFDDIFQMAGPYLDVPRLTHVLYQLHLNLTQCKSRPERRYESYHQESWEEGRRDTQSKMYLIFTSDSTALGHAILQLEGQTFRFFSNCTIADLTRTESLCYTEEEKKTIWLKHKSHYKYKAKAELIGLSGNAKQSIGFPLVCKLFASCVNFQENPKTFLENPLSTFKSVLTKVIDRRDDQSAALILVLLCDGQLNIGQLETESDPALKTHLQAVLTFVPKSTIQGVAEAVRSLCGSLLTEGRTTTFSHSVIYDVCASALYNIEPEFIRKHFSIQFLMEHVEDQQMGIVPVSEYQLIIVFSETYSKTLIERMVGSLVNDGTIGKYIMHPILKRKEIAERLLQLINDETSLSDYAKHNIFCYGCFTWDKSIMKKCFPHCDINSPGLNGWTPAWHAIVSGYKDSIKYLMEHKRATKENGVDKNSLLHVASEYGTAAIVEYLLNDLKCDIHSRGVRGWTPVTRAVFAGKKDVLDVLLKHKGLPAFIGERALHLACEWGKLTLMQTLTSKTDIDSPGKHDQKAIMCAVASGKKDIFNLVSRNADLKLTDNDSNSLLHLACQPDDTAILENLISQLDINRPGQHGWTPVMKAAVNGRKDVYDLLVKENADLKLTDHNGNNLLHLACHGGNVAIVNSLLPQFDIDSRGSNGWTPVMFAAVNGHKHVFFLLESKGADLSLKDDYNNSVFHLGCLGGSVIIVKHLLPKVDLNRKGNLGRTGVMKAAWAGNAEVFEHLVSKKADLKTLDDNNDTILHLASQGGNCCIVDYLVEKGSDINCRGKNDWTPVMNAAWYGKKDVFDLLSLKQDSMSVYNIYGDTILHLACEGGNVSIVHSLPSTLDVNIRGKNGHNPVMAAVLAGKYEVFDHLVSMNADLKLTDENLNNILHLACRGGNRLIIECLLPHFDINVPGEDGITPLMMAALSGKKEAYDLLVTRRPEKTVLTSMGDNVLHAACQGGSLAIVKQVVDSFDINCRGKNGRTPLMRAVCGGHIAVYKYLVSRGADGTLVDKDGHTLLHLASLHGQLSVLKHIIDCEKNIDVNAKDLMGLTPAITAVLHGKAAVLKSLKDKAADLSLLDNTGDDAFTLALKLGSKQIIKQLDRKHDKKVTPWDNLMKSVVRGDLTLLKTYRQKSPDLVQKDQAGDTVLHLACRGGNVPCVEYLLPSYDINVQGRYNWTPVMMAAACGHADVFKFLVEHKAGLFHVSETEEDIVTLARRSNNTEIIAYLEKPE